MKWIPILILIFASCKTPQLYTKYLVNYRDGNSQVLIYPYHWDVISMIDTTQFRIHHIDTIQYRVKEKDIN